MIKKKIKPLNAIYFCPHHPESGFEKENKAYKIKCECRKPNIGMVSKAIEDLHLENSKYFFVGDTKNDYLLSKKLTRKFILLNLQQIVITVISVVKKIFIEAISQMEKKVC